MLNYSHPVHAMTADKHGWRSTVYRTLGMGLSASSVTAPGEDHSRREKLARETARELIQDLHTTEEAAMRQRVVAEIRKYPVDLLEGLRDAITNPDSWVELEHLRESLCELIAERPSEEKVWEAVLLFPVVCLWNSEIARAIIDSLPEYDQIPSWSDLSLESDEVKNKCVAMATVVGEVYFLSGQSSTGNMVLGDDALVELIFKYPDRARQIARAIRERNTADPVLLRGIIASDSRVLSEGSL